jgi:hypothetical protein
VLDGVDDGNNVGWSFGPRLCRWTGASSAGDLWSDDANWTPSPPASGDSVAFDPVGGTSVADLPGLSLASLDMAGYSGVLLLGTALDVTGDVTTAGTLDLAGRTLFVADALSVHGALELGGGTLAVSGTTTVVGLLGSGGAGGSASFGGSVQVVAGGDLRAPPTASFGAELRVEDGRMEISEPGSVVLFAGDVTGEQGALLRVVGPGADVAFAAGRTLRVDAGVDLEVEGAAMSPLTLRKAGPGGGTRWLVDLHPASFASIRYVRVGDSDASAGETALARDSEDLGNNVNWHFGATGIGAGVVPATLSAALAPNPFRAATVARLALPRGGALRVRVWDARGRLVRSLVDERADPGFRSVEWDGRDGRGRPVASGVYFLRVEAEAGSVTRTITRVR